MLVVLSLLVYSCASIGSPSGGGYDFDPPVIVRTTPAENATNVKTRRIVLEFDELVQIEKPSEKVIVTPPQRGMPVIRAQNNKVIVELKDTLLPNTTYTIDFTDAIADNNEKNPLENYAFSFSTGDVVDSLSVSGKVLQAENLEPVPSMYVGIHANLNDTAFTKTKFDRISRTNESGEFSIKGMSPGTYRIYALNDMNRDYMYDNPTEAIAFYETLIVPSHERAVRIDTIFNLDHSVDTVKEVEYTRFTPDNIIMRSFVSSFKRQYLQKTERTINEKISLYFGAPQEEVSIKPLNFDVEDWGLLERSWNNDTIHHWIKNPEVAQMDTLQFEVIYHKSDSLNLPVLTTDTINFVNRQRKQQEREREKRLKDLEDPKKKNKEELYEFLDLKANVSGAWDAYKAVRIEFAEPVSDFDPKKIKVQQLVDSTYTDLDINLLTDEVNPRIYTIGNKWLFGGSYRLVADSAVFHSYTGKWNKKLSIDFKVKPVEDYGHLYLDLQNLPDSVPAFVELLNASDMPIRKAQVVDNGALFMNLNPAKYYARIIIDRNGNGLWDTGDFDIDLQPEEVYYCPKMFEIKANWEMEESWDITALPLDKQKPLEITKQKPKDKESRRKELEQREEKERQRSNSRSQNNTNNVNGNMNSNRNTTSRNNNY